MFKDPDDLRRQYALIPRHKIRGWIWKYTNSRAPLNELVHEVNARIAVIDGVKAAGVDSLESYVHGICRYVAIDWVRSRQRLRQTRSKVDPEAIRHPTENPERTAAAEQELERLQKALNELPEKQRRVYWYRKIFRYTDEEIARMMSLGEREVQNTLRRAVRRIDAAIRAAGGDASLGPDGCQLGFGEDV